MVGSRRDYLEWPKDKTHMNRHGLARYIPEEIAREVRKRCGFGCVYCGNAFVDYDHFEPEFKDARRHDPNGIILLCRQCHGKKTSGLLSKRSIQQKLDKPFAIRRGFSSEEFDVGSKWPEIVLGPARVKMGYVVLECAGKDVFWIDQPEESGGPFRLNATFRNQDGDITLQITDNIWQVRTGNWDAVQEGKVIKLWRGPRDVVLTLESHPPDELVVGRLKMKTNNYEIELNDDNVAVTTPGGRIDKLGEVTTISGYAAISIGPDGIHLNAPATPDKRADFPAPSVSTGAKAAGDRKPLSVGSGVVEFGSTPTVIGGASFSGFSIYGGGIRAIPGGGAELVPSLRRSTDDSNKT